MTSASSRDAKSLPSYVGRDDRFPRDKVNWLKLFPTPKAKDGEKLTPRMAYQLWHQAVILNDMIGEDDFIVRDDLPAVARPFLKQRAWRDNFRQCFVRLGLRLMLGKLPEPNCTGEEIAFKVMIDHAK